MNNHQRWHIFFISSWRTKCQCLHVELFSRNKWDHKYISHHAGRHSLHPREMFIAYWELSSGYIQFQKICRINFFSCELCYNNTDNQLFPLIISPGVTGARRQIWALLQHRLGRNENILWRFHFCWAQQGGRRYLQLCWIFAVPNCVDLLYSAQKHNFGWYLSWFRMAGSEKPVESVSKSWFGLGFVFKVRKSKNEGKRNPS